MDRRVDYLSLPTAAKCKCRLKRFWFFPLISIPLNWATKHSCAAFNTRCCCAVPTKMSSIPFSAAIANLKICRAASEDHWQIHRSALHSNAAKLFAVVIRATLISQVIDHIHFRRLPFELTEELLDRAFEGCFLQVLTSTIKASRVRSFIFTMKLYRTAVAYFVEEAAQFYRGDDTAWDVLICAR